MNPHSPISLSSNEPLLSPNEQEALSLLFFSQQVSQIPIDEKSSTEKNTNQIWSKEASTFSVFMPPAPGPSPSATEAIKKVKKSNPDKVSKAKSKTSEKIRKTFRKAATQDFIITPPADEEWKTHPEKIPSLIQEGSQALGLYKKTKERQRLAAGMTYLTSPKGSEFLIVVEGQLIGKFKRLGSRKKNSGLPPEFIKQPLFKLKLVDDLREIEWLRNDVRTQCIPKLKELFGEEYLQTTYPATREKAFQEMLIAAIYCFKKSALPNQ